MEDERLNDVRIFCPKCGMKRLKLDRGFGSYSNVYGCDACGYEVELRDADVREAAGLPEIDRD